MLHAPASSCSPELDTALAAAEAANRIVRAHYGRSPGVRIKSDSSPVTEADVAVEQAIRAVIGARFPAHAFYGEETGRSAPPGAAPVWIVDPIDGTRAFIREYPMFSTQIALAVDGRIRLGVSSAPLYGELAWAEAGQGAYLNGRPLAVSDVSDLESAVLSVGNIKDLAAQARWANYGELVRRVAYSRGYGEFLQYHLLAAGKLDVVLEVGIKIYDVAALCAIVTEAGGRCTEVGGGEIGEQSTTILAANPRLHAQALEVLNDLCERG